MHLRNLSKTISFIVGSAAICGFLFVIAKIALFKQVILVEPNPLILALEFIILLVGLVLSVAWFLSE